MNRPTATPASGAPATGPDAELSEILTFRIGGEEYGIDILQVQEIRGYEGVTRLPETVSWMKGVINLRGTIVPVIDLRLKLHRGEARYDAGTCMVVVTLGSGVAGLVVDAVCDVTALSPDQIRPTPALGGGIDMSALRGIASQGERMIILLDLRILLDGALPDADELLADAA